MKYKYNFQLIDENDLVVYVEVGDGEMRDILLKVYELESRCLREILK